jgi:hypothetical protein
MKGYEHKLPLSVKGQRGLHPPPPPLYRTKVTGKPRESPVARAAAILAILAVCSTYMVWGGWRGTLAKYRAAASGSSTVTVALWKIGTKRNSGAATNWGGVVITSNWTTSRNIYTFDVQNSSEVTARFKTKLNLVTGTGLAGTAPAVWTIKNAAGTTLASNTNNPTNVIENTAYEDRAISSAATTYTFAVTPYSTAPGTTTATVTAAGSSTKNMADLWKTQRFTFPVSAVQVD